MTKKRPFEAINSQALLTIKEGLANVDLQASLLSINLLCRSYRCLLNIQAI